MVRWPASASATILRYRGSNTCSGSGMRGKSTVSGRGNSGMTEGSTGTIVWGLRPRRPEPAASLAADDLDGQVAVARPVQLGRDDGLELPEHELALADRKRHRVPKQAGLQVRVRVLPVAVGVLGIVVPPALQRAHDLVQHGLDVVE